MIILKKEIVNHIEFLHNIAEQISILRIEKLKLTDELIRLTDIKKSIDSKINYFDDSYAMEMGKLKEMLLENIEERG